MVLAVLGALARCHDNTDNNTDTADTATVIGPRPMVRDAACTWLFGRPAG